MSAPTRIRKRTRNGVENRIQLDRIIVGERARKDMGDIDALMASMTELTQLQPIVLAPGNELLIGGRRLEAAKRLGWTDIKFVRAEGLDDAIKLLKAEREENTCRKDMTASELVAIADRLRVIESAEAKERQGKRTDLTFPSVDGNVPKFKNEAAYKVAQALGTSETTLRRATTVKRAAGGVGVTPEVQEVAKAAMADLDAGTISPSAAAAKVRDAKSGVVALPDETPGIDDLPAEKPDGWTPAKRQSAEGKKQALTINRVLMQLDGIVMATDFRDIHIDAEKASQLAADLSIRVRSLNQLAKQLRKASVPA